MPSPLKTCRLLILFIIIVFNGEFSASAQQLLYPEQFAKSHADSTHSSADSAPDQNSLLFNGFEYIPTITATTASPFFLDDSIRNGNLTYFSENFFNVPVQYDLENDQLVFFPDQPPYRLVLVPEAVNAFQIGSHHFISERAVDSSRGAGFMELLAEGHTVQLLAKHRKLPDERIRDLQLKRGYRRSTDFFISVNNHLVPVDNARSLIRSLPGFREAMASFAKQEGISNRSTNPAQLIKLIRYYDSL